MRERKIESVWQNIWRTSETLIIRQNEDGSTRSNSMKLILCRDWLWFSCNSHILFSEFMISGSDFFNERWKYNYKINYNYLTLGIFSDTGERLTTAFAAAAAKSLQSCPTLCDPIDSSPAGSPIPGILQARTLEWVAISFSNARKWKVKVKSLSHVLCFMTPWTAAYQAPLPMGFSRQEYWSGVPLPSPNYSL